MRVHTVGLGLTTPAEHVRMLERFKKEALDERATPGEATMIRLSGIGHVLLRVSDVERSRAFYSTILGLKVVEEDPEHGGIFMALEGHGHTVDLFPAQNPETAQRQAAGGVGVHHIAFHVGSEEALKDAYFTLQEHGVTIVRAVDHVSQKSIYFDDPDGNRLEIYYELPNAPELFRQGRHDRDAPLVFEARGSRR